MATLAELRKTSDIVERAYRFAEWAHRGQKRRTGDPYFTHVVATADQLAKWGMDETTIAAGLLHDVVEDTEVTESDVRKKFGREIAKLVDGITKLGSVKYRGDKSQAENLRKLILAMAEDLRVILIKLSDRLHNMKTLQPLPREKQERIALETMEIYAPLAYRLGMQGLSGELQDLAFPYAYPDEYRWIVDHIKERYEERQAYLRRLEPKVKQALEESDIDVVSMDFRAKRYASLYKKLLKNDMDIDKIYDLVAFRIIVKDVEGCYATLGVIHNMWPPLPAKIKDYIATPKPNGYRSLHTTVLGPDKKIVEFQIRTEEMHQEAENGIAANWAYEESKGTKGYKRGRAPKASQKEAAWVEQLRSWQKGFTHPEDFIDAFKIDFLKDNIFALTPKGEVVDLPAGATPVDFAYHIHTDIGNQCVGAKVNGKIVPLDYKLESSDVVEIITQKNKKPSPSWLDFAVTSSAKSHIRNALKKSDKRRFLGAKEQKIELKLVVENTPGILAEVSSIISRSHINIVTLSSVPRDRDSYHTIKVLCNTDNKNKILKIILKLKALKAVKEIDYRFV
jgi:GTP pyrophosphokinase